MRRAEVIDFIRAESARGIMAKDIATAIGFSRSYLCAVMKAAGIDARPPLIKKCKTCGSDFRSSPSTKRIYCSYKCHLDDGGAKRAGEAAIMARLKYGAKKDANHNEVFEAISQFTAVKDLSSAGCGVPDGIAWVAGSWQLFDVKNPKTGYGRRGLNPIQKGWADDWRGGPVFLIYSVEEAFRFAKGNFEGLKKFPDDFQKAIGLPLAGQIR